MEFIFGTRGHIDNTEKLIRNLRSVWMPFEYVTPDGMKAQAIEMNVKPLLLWDIAFPKENLDTVLNTLLGDNWAQQKADMEKRYPFIFTKVISFLRKKIGLKPLPESRKHDKRFPVYTGAVEIFPIGIKEDAPIKDAEGNIKDGV